MVVVSLTENQQLTNVRVSLNEVGGLRNNKLEDLLRGSCLMGGVIGAWGPRFSLVRWLQVAAVGTRLARLARLASSPLARSGLPGSQARQGLSRASTGQNASRGDPQRLRAFTDSV